MEKVKNAVIVVLLLLVLALSNALIRVENQRYAMSVGMCYDERLKLPDLTCVSKARTRTNPIWHLFHGLFG